MKESIHTAQAPAAIGPYSQAIRANGFVFVSGQLPVDPATGSFAGADVTAQTRQSLQNIQSILAEAGLGMDAVVLTGACADLYGPKTVRATMGALFRQPVLTCTLDELMQLLRANGLRLYGAALTDTAQDLRRVPLTPAAVAIGSEGRGLSAELLAQCDGQIIIPMQPGAESLNAAVAAAVVMWEIARTET